VGDSLSTDLRGARTADLWVLLLKRTASVARAGQIKSLLELC